MDKELYFQHMIPEILEIHTYETMNFETHLHYIPKFTEILSGRSAVANARGEEVTDNGDKEIFAHNGNAIYLQCSAHFILCDVCPMHSYVIRRLKFTAYT